MVTVWGELSPAKPLDATERVLIRAGRKSASESAADQLCLK